MEKENRTYSAAVLPVIGTLLLPETKIQLKNLTAAEAARLQEGEFAAIPVRGDEHKDHWTEADFYPFGVTCMVTEMKEDGKYVELQVTAIERIHVGQLFEGRYPSCTFELAEDEMDLSERSETEMLEYMKQTIREIGASLRGSGPVVRMAEGVSSLNQLITYISQYMPLTQSERYELLAEPSLKKRSLQFIDLLLRQKEMISLNMEMQEKLSDQANRYYREQALRRQMEAIRAELNEGGEDEADEKSYHEQIRESFMPEDVKKAFLKEADKLEASAAQGGTEADIIRNYIEYALALPWKKEELKNADLDEARKILNQRHYGMDKVKERIIQHLAIMRLKNSSKGSALLLVGPPGTGKTSLGKSIAEALDRPYTRLSLGGIRDESEIRGHRRTYVGAMAGRILQTMKQAGKTNPVMILDEIDKMMAGGFSGDPAAAMLEVLDPEQNNTFTDHYLDQPYDLSDVFFIATANSLDTIPAPLLDRMEVIEIPSYTAEEKFHIAKEHLVPRTLEEFGIGEDKLVIEDEAIRSVVDDYTMEAGCRGLQKRLAQICRCRSEAILKDEGTITITKADLEDILGPIRARHEKVKDANPAGVVTGLAWTPVGGEVLYIETMDMPGSGQTILTGKLGEVMQESARISLTVLKSRLPMDAMNLKNRDIHIHVPAGATPKDGPSAGITLFTALASLATNRPVDSHIAMTGELTLRGEVYPIGGLREKLFGAMRAGITKVLIPWDNQCDLKEVSPEVLEALEIVPVKTVEDVMRETLGITLPPMEHLLVHEGGLSKYMIQ